MSLTSCLRKAGDLLPAKTRKAIMARARELRGQKMSAKDAALQAVNEQLESTRQSLREAGDQSGIRNSAREGDDLGAFNLDHMLSDDFVPDEVVKDSGLSEDEIAHLNAELAQEQGYVGDPEDAEPQHYEPPSESTLKSVGIMAEEAYKPLQYEGDGEKQVSRLKMGGRTYRFAVKQRINGNFNADPHYRGDEGAGAAYGLNNLSEQGAKAWNRRVAASIDLTKRGFDLYTAVPSAARTRVVQAWKDIAKLPGAFEFGQPKFDALSPSVQKLQQIADSMLQGSRYSADVSPGELGWFTVTITDHKSGNVGTAQVQYIGGADKKLVMHTQEFDAGSGLGKPFYQVAFAFGHELGIPTNADRNGLLGVNNYRRTEQMMSAAARAGTAGAVNPGVGQRIYGWNAKAKTGEQQDRNFARIALAAARNAAEIAPQVRDMRYDIGQDKFDWRNGKGRDESAEDVVKRVLATPDARSVSLSRSTLARAALTFQAMDGKLDLSNVKSVASPVLYSRRGGQLDGPSKFFSARTQLNRAIAERNQSLHSVNPASVLEADIGRASQALDIAVQEIKAGNAPQLEIPIGPMPHVLHMLGAPMQMMAANTSIIDKILVGKHAQDFAGLTSREFVEALYKPVMVLQSRNADEYELVTSLKNAAGEPLTAVVKVNVQSEPGEGGKPVRSARLMSAYARPVAGYKDSLLDRVLAGKARYVEMDKARSAFNNFWTRFQPSLARGLEARKIKDDLALVKFIGDRYDPASSEHGWGDAPSFSQRTQGRFELPEYGAGAKFVEAIQDRYNRWKQTVNAVREQGGKVDETNDFYQAEERYWGRVGSQIDDFKADMEKFVGDVTHDGLNLEDVALYAYAQHAQERNAWIAQKRPGMPDGGSGMSNQDAQDILDDAVASGLAPLLDKHAGTLRQWIQGTRDILFQNGLIDQDEYDAWNQTFSNYVPLRGLEGAEDRPRTGRGFDIHGPESKTAMGRRSEAKQIIEQIIQDRTRALIRVGKNDVLRTFAQFVLDNPDPRLWAINAVETKPVTTVDANGNRIIEEQQRLIDDDRTVTVKDGGKEVHIVVRDDRLRSQLQNLHVESVGQVVGALLWVNRKLSHLYTTLSPTFTILNGLRDFAMANTMILDDIGYSGVPLLWKEMPGAMRDSFASEFGAAPSPEYELYRKTGGKTGFFDFKTLDAQTDELMQLASHADQSNYDPRKVGRAALHVIEAINGGVENATRFAAFRAALRAGKSVAEASHISKNITVNFNRKGTLTPQLTAWVMFFNPSVQDVARVAQGLKSPKVWSAIGMGMVGLFALAMRNAAMGDDDDGVAWWDKIPDSVKERNTVIVLPPNATGGEAIPGSKTGRYIKIPRPYGLNFFGVVATQMADVWRHMQDPKRGRGATEAMVRAFNAFLGSYAPGSDISRSLDPSKPLMDPSRLLPFVPDSLNPLASVLMNQNAFGSKLFPDDKHAQNAPRSKQLFVGQAGTIWQRAADSMSSATGGDGVNPGLVEIQPGVLEAMARAYGGGPVSFSLDLLNAIYERQSIKRNDPDYRRLPFAKQLYGVIDAETDRSLSFDRLQKADEASSRLDAAMKAGSPAAAKRAVDDSDGLAVLGEAVRQTNAKLSDIRKAELAVLANDKLPDAAKYAELLSLEAKRHQVTNAFNAVYDQTIERQFELRKRAAGTPAR
jgi:hypothetical protein